MHRRAPVKSSALYFRMPSLCFLSPIPFHTSTHSAAPTSTSSRPHPPPSHSPLPSPPLPAPTTLPRLPTTASVPPLNVVITGGSRGIGFALAADFLSRGDSVVICARTSADVSSALAALNSRSPPPARAFGIAADVSDAASVASLSAYAARVLGRVDCWVNNAGQSGGRARLVDLGPEEIVGVVGTNLIGGLLCCREAEALMRTSGGHVFCMDGLGSSGSSTARYVPYGATKRPVEQMVAGLAKEMKDGRVKFHVLSPGMVLTDLLLAGNATDMSSLKFFNFLAEEPETVAANLVPRIREVVMENKSGSKYVKFLTLPRAFAQIAAGVLFGYRANRYFDKDGNRVDRDEVEYDVNGVRRPW